VFDTDGRPRRDNASEDKPPRVVLDLSWFPSAKARQRADAQTGRPETMLWSRHCHGVVHELAEAEAIQLREPSSGLSHGTGGAD